jgi:Flp pilus assembly pilin Flp
MLASPSSNCADQDNEVAKTTTALQPHKSLRRRRGATAMEYLFVLSLIFIVAMTGINYLGQSVKQLSEANSEAVQKATQGSGPGNQ